MEAVTKAVEKAADAVPDAVTKLIPSSDSIPPQRQHQQPGVEEEMTPQPTYIADDYKGSGKLKGKRALITGGDSGIGRAVAVHYAREGAKAIVIVYKGGPEDVDAKETVKLVEAEGATCTALVADLRDPAACEKAVETAVKAMEGLDILVSNAAEQHYRHSIADITDEQLHDTFATNVFAAFNLSRAALPHLKSGSSIIITSSITAFKGEPQLLDYSATKGALIAFTKGLAQQLVEKGIRVNAVAPGPIWTPLIPATFPKAALPTWKSAAPMGRAGQPSEVAPSYVFLASEDSTYFTAQVLHPNGGAPGYS